VRRGERRNDLLARGEKGKGDLTYQGRQKGGGGGGKPERTQPLHAEGRFTSRGEKKGENSPCDWKKREVFPSLGREEKKSQLSTGLGKGKSKKSSKRKKKGRSRSFPLFPEKVGAHRSQGAAKREEKKGRAPFPPPGKEKRPEDFFVKFRKARSDNLLKVRCGSPGRKEKRRKWMNRKTERRFSRKRKEIRRKEKRKRDRPRERGEGKKRIGTHRSRPSKEKKIVR